MGATNPIRRILILRHAKSDWTAGAASDFERPLNDRGRRAAATMGAFLADECRAPSLVLCSSARRAAETWSIIAHHWAEAPEATLDRSLYLARMQDLLKRLRCLEDDVNIVCLVGHHPGHDGLAITLTKDRAAPEAIAMQLKFPTAALAELSYSGLWADLSPGSAQLERFVRPKDLI
ncbi:MAG: histidine phosphatase family protein [Rhodospirillaceae bacterium]|nr:histidine phosphatase family protein [Rhodospirillaceae bacterium]MCY4238812.1 histidine phosphatase family protein [Rhodospirillaceae bacterium]MCY4310257.1 histidine phosphatase family protein [Rhodospirillaceae bacterium]